MKTAQEWVEGTRLDIRHDLPKYADWELPKLEYKKDDRPEPQPVPFPDVSHIGKVQIVRTDQEYEALFRKALESLKMEEKETVSYPAVNSHGFEYTEKHDYHEYNEAVREINSAIDRLLEI